MKLPSLNLDFVSYLVFNFLFSFHQFYNVFIYFVITLFFASGWNEERLV